MNYRAIKKKIVLPMYIYYQFLRFFTALTVGAGPKVIYQKNNKGKTKNIKIEYPLSYKKKGEDKEISPYKVFMIETAPILGAVYLFIIIVWQIHNAYWQLYSILGAYYFYSFDIWIHNLDIKRIKKYWLILTTKEDNKDETI